MSLIDDGIDDLDTPIEDADDEESADELIEGSDEWWEMRARQMGWHPLPGPGVDAADAYRGPRDRWSDPRAFVENAETQLPVARNRLKQMSEQLRRTDLKTADLEARLARQAEEIAELRTVARTADDRGYKRAVQELKEQRRQAVLDDDTVLADKVQEQIDALTEERAKTPAASPPSPPSPSSQNIDPAITAFMDANPWFNKDPGLTKAMIGQHDIVAADHPAWSMERQLATALTTLKRANPSKFADPDDGDDDEEEEDDVPQSRRTQRGAAVLPPRSGAGGGQGSRDRSVWGQIPDPTERAQAKAQYQRALRNDPGLTEAEWVEIVLNPHGDTLAIRQKHRKKA